jgi:glycerol uptake facilitator-like aquaporin
MRAWLGCSCTWFYSGSFCLRLWTYFRHACKPSCDFALALNKTIKWGQAVFYWIAQFAGAILAAFLLKFMRLSLGGTIQAGATVGALTDKAQPFLAMVLKPS